ELAEHVVDVSASLNGSKQLDVHLNIAKVFHINANEAGERLIPTRLDVLGDVAGDVESIDYPPPQMQQFVFADEPIPVYSGTVWISVRFKTQVPSVLRLALTYQPCSENACLPAIRKELDLHLTT